MVKKTDAKVMFYNVSGVAQIQEKCAYGLGCKITLKRYNNIDVLNKATAPAVVDAKIVISGIGWYVTHYTPSIEQEAIIPQ